ncbi:hypothetical protein BDW22DRAFT_1431089 [Trametopsis cervina]|nr:hypothetical protein BDW22DRAFT_1431089 [Trametopsis cervina]
MSPPRSPRLVLSPKQPTSSNTPDLPSCPTEWQWKIEYSALLKSPSAAMNPSATTDDMPPPLATDSAPRHKPRPKPLPVYNSWRVNSSGVPSSSTSAASSSQRVLQFDAGPSIASTAVSAVSTAMSAAASTPAFEPQDRTHPPAPRRRPAPRMVKRTLEPPK